MRIQKIAQATITAATAIVLSAAPAFAAVNDTTVINSGADATVNSNTTTNSSTVVTNTNNAVVTQDVHAVSNTGGNDANGNINLGGVGGSINTGAATVNTNLGVDVNHNETAVTGAGAQATANVLDVVNTGYNADVNANATNNSSVVVTNANNAVVSQSAYEKANTGKNDANSNIGGGVIHTGAANVNTGMSVAANHNATAVGAGYGAGTLTNGAALLNETNVMNTGADVDINSNATSNNAAVVTNYNSLWSYQNVFAKSNTGKNDANSNIGGGVIGTGAANVGTSAVVNANDNATVIAGFGTGGELNVADIINTGYNLDSNTNVTANNTDVVTNANDLWGYQSVWEYSKTGYNDTNSNIGGGLVGTSGATVGTGLTVGGNHNATGIGWLLPFWSLFGM